MRRASTLIVVPQDTEFVPLIEGFRGLGLEVELDSVERIQVGRVEALDLLVGVSGHGKTQTALQCQYLIDRSPGVTRLICVGAAGSLSNLVQFGDVVIGTFSVEHDYKLRFVHAPSPVHPSEPVLLAGIKKALTNFGMPFEVHFGPIASGDEDVVDRLRAEELRTNTGALCGSSRCGSLQMPQTVTPRGRSTRTYTWSCGTSPYCLRDARKSLSLPLIANTRNGQQTARCETLTRPFADTCVYNSSLTP
jgi:adenosylhomocysteine nucleosidase